MGTQAVVDVDEKKRSKRRGRVEGPGVGERYEERERKEIISQQDNDFIIPIYCFG